jgi:anaerobic selenocysteine-containing dehydrogenase
MTEVRTVPPSVSKNPIALNATDLATVCVLCSHNCGIRVDVVDGRITDIRADDRNPITQGYICNKAVTVDRYAHHDQRVQHPMRRREDGTFERISWDIAISEIAAKLEFLREEHGPRSIGLVGIGGRGCSMPRRPCSSTPTWRTSNS